MHPFSNRDGGKPSQSQRSRPYPARSNPQNQAPTSESQPGQSLDAIRQSQLYRQHLAHQQCAKCDYFTATPKSQDQGQQQTPFHLNDARNFPNVYNAVFNSSLPMNPDLIARRCDCDSCISQYLSMVTTDYPCDGTQTYAPGETVSSESVMGHYETEKLSALGGTSGGRFGAIDNSGLRGVPRQLRSPPPYPQRNGGGDVQSREIKKIQTQMTSGSRESTAPETPYLTHAVEVFETGNEVNVGIGHAGGGSYIVIPASVHLGKVNSDDPEDVKKFQIVMNYKYNHQLLERVEIRAITVSGTGSVKTESDTGLWEVYVKQGPLFVQKFVTRVKPRKTEFCLQLVTDWFKKMYLLGMNGCKCWPLTEPTSVWESHSHEDICPNHFRGIGEERMAQIREVVDLKFAPKVLKFVVGKNFLGFVTDPEKLGVDDFASKKFWYVSQQVVEYILAKFASYELGGYFCDGC